MSDTSRAVALGPYSAAVRRYFADPAHGGDPDPGAGNVWTAEASEPASGAIIRLSVTTAGRRIRAMRYRVFGCPHLIAALERCCERFEGESLESLAEFDLAELMRALQVPVDKTVRMLLIEDVIRSVCELADRPGENETGT